MSGIHCPRCDWMIPTTPGLPVPAMCPACGMVLDTATRESSPSAAAAATDSPPLWRMLGEDGAEYGPVTKAELDQWLREGRVSPRCQIAAGPEAPWVPAGDIYPQLRIPHTAPTQTFAYPPSPTVERQWIVALLLAILPPFAGICGLHRFYSGHYLLGFFELITFGFCGVGQLIDIILIASGSYVDAEGKPLA